MSVFRIQRKKNQIDSRHKVHSQQSKTYSKHPNNLAQLLTTVRSKEKSHDEIKRRVFTIQTRQNDASNYKIKRISDVYNISSIRGEHERNQRFSKKSLSREKGLQSFELRRKQSNKINSYESIVRSSPKLQLKMSSNHKISGKMTANKSNKFLQKKKTSLNTSFISKSNSKIESNRGFSNQKSEQVKKVFNEALKYYKTKNTAASLQLFIQVLKNQPQHVECLYYVGSCYLNMGKNQKSLKYLNQLKLINLSYSPNTFLYLAINYKFLNRSEQSIKVLEEGLKLFPKFQEGFFYLGKLQSKNQRYHKAISAFQKCVYLNQKNFLAKIQLADALQFVNKQEKAIEIYKEVLKSQNNIIMTQSSLTQKTTTNCLNQKSKKTAHLKLIKLLFQSQKYEDPDLNSSLQVLSEMKDQSPEFIFFSSFMKYEKEQTIKQNNLPAIKTHLQLLLNQACSYWLTLESLKLLLKIYVDSKDMYGAEELLKTSHRLQIKRQDLLEWILLVEGANDIIKRKTEQGKQKLEQCLVKVNKKLNANPSVDYTKRSYTQKIQHLQSLNISYLQYIRFHNLQYLAYVNFLDANYDKSLQFYQELLTFYAKGETKKTNYLTQRSTTNQSFIRKYQKSLNEVSLNKTIVQALISHNKGQKYLKAKIGFEKALSIRQRPETIFMWIINEVSILQAIQQEKFSDQKDKMYDYAKDFDWRRLSQRIKKAEQISPKFSLIYFYHSLLDLYLQNYSQALQNVQMAIQTVQEPVSQYHFIQALCFYLIYEELNDYSIAKKGLQAIDKAIQIDNSIPQFYKERSKHYFCLSKLQEAIKDCEKTQSQSEDEQTKLLCMFYLYVNCDYEKSQTLLKQFIFPRLKQTKPQEYPNNFILSEDQYTNDHKYKQFEQALMFRLKRYQKSGILGKLLSNLTQQNEKKLDQEYLGLLQNMIENRNQYSQFTVYFINLLLAVYQVSQKQYSVCLNYLFCCLQEIQSIVDEKNKNIIQSDGQDQDLEQKGRSFADQICQIDTDSMLNEIKYNIVLATLLKNNDECTKKSQSKPQNETLKRSNRIYHETLTFVQTFIKQSESEELIEDLQVIRKLIQQSFSDHLHERQKNDISITLKPFIETQKFSDLFPTMNVPIGDKYNLITKFIVFYPNKLKFNIRPEFDPSFLFNFEIDKVDNKLIPPWFKFAQNSQSSHYKNRMIFTDQLRNQSIAISQTQRQPSILENPKVSKNRYQTYQNNDSQTGIYKSGHNQSDKKHNLRTIMKLDSMIENKLKKLFPK